ncbi:hypothetical protein NE237_012567 [Protea cynaroides]|uniref:Membrane protein of ER body-like protein n=1 Tax=Protea cynaroides TaxID=273540 RepID=A0A9Q0GY72_9MAGN|nr:hypothetical protein NE237_012567 [Protea cynaroides]
MSMEAATMEEVEAEEGLIDDGADLRTRPRSRTRLQEFTAISISDATVNTIVEETVEEHGSEQEGVEAERSVYFEGNENGGIESNDTTAGRKTGNENSYFNVPQSDSQKSSMTIDDDKIDGNLKDGSLYDLHILPSEKSKSGRSMSFEPVDNELKVHAYGSTLEDRRQGITELDVERVIEDQDSHDLYCPNCNSCITKRVILRKRKRRVQSIHYDTKRERIETVVNLVGSSFASATNDDSSEVGQSVPDGSPPPPVNDHDRDMGPDVFRCLSCFTFFIPTGSGFKLFRIFGGLGESENTPNPEQISMRNNNWFSPSHKSIGRNDTAEQVDVTTQHVEEAAEALRQSEYLSETLPGKQMDHLSNQGVPSPTHADGNAISVTSSKFVVVKESHVNENIEGSSGEFQNDMQNVNVAFVQGAVLSAESQSDIALKDGATKKTDRAYADGSATSVASSKIVVVKESHVNEKIKVSAGEFQNDMHNVNAAFVQGAVLSEESQSDIALKDGATKKTDRAYADGSATSVASSKIVVVKESHVNEKIKVSAGEFQNDMHNVNAAFVQGAVLSEESQSDIALKDGVTKKTDRVVEEEALRQSECFPETLPGQQMDQLPNQSVFSRGTGSQQVGVNYAIFPIEKPTFTFTEKTVTSSVERQYVTTGNISKGDDVAVYIQTDQDMHDVVDSLVPGRAREWDVLKSIIYGGLIESITSLGVVSSAAASAASTLNIVILGLANLMSGLFIIIHNIKDLKNDYRGTTSQENSNMDRYQEALGRRENFRLHAIVAVLSYIIFGLLPPVTYGFSFRRSDDKLYKLITCGAASFVCIILLAIGKAYVRRPPRFYVKTVLYYLLMGMTASGLCYAVGLLIKRLIENLGWFDTLSVPSTEFLETRSMGSGWASS